MTMESPKNLAKMRNTLIFQYCCGTILTKYRLAASARHHKVSYVMV